jgi:hypothetical protein
VVRNLPVDDPYIYIFVSSSSVPQTQTQTPLHQNVASRSRCTGLRWPRSLAAAFKMNKQHNGKPSKYKKG